MPLLDHFRPPLDDVRSWEEFHGQWPAMIVMALNATLPERYVAAPHVRLGASFEIDIASFDEDRSQERVGEPVAERVATMTWAPPRPTFEVAARLPEYDEYEVRIYDHERRRRLVAMVEIVSPANKDRPESRRAFVAKCAAFLREGVSVALVDLVTIRSANLYAQLLEDLGQADPSLAREPSSTYAASCQWVHEADDGRFRAWMHPLILGKPLPTLPLWLAPDLAVPLDLETTYETTRRTLRIGTMVR